MIRPRSGVHDDAHRLQMVVRRRPDELLGRCACGRYDEGSTVAVLLVLVEAHQALELRSVGG